MCLKLNTLLTIVPSISKLLSWLVFCAKVNFTVLNNTAKISRYRALFKKC